MKVLIELYDKDTLKNIVAPLTLRPDRVVYLYDKGMDDRHQLCENPVCGGLPCGRAVRGGKLHAGADGRQ